MKKIYSLVIGAAFLIGGSWGVYSYANLSKESLSDATLENIEALTDDPEGGGGTSCRWVRSKDDHGCVVHYCVTTGDGNSCSCGSVS